MKVLKPTLFLILMALAVVACGPKGSTVETSDAKAVASSEDAVQLAVNTDKSIVTWIGSKPAGKHNGTINISEGKIGVNGDQIVSGNFTIDIKSLEDLDMAGSDGAAKLKGHLMSDDFFAAEQFPQATFELTGIDLFNTAGLEADSEEFVTENTPAKLSEILVENPTHFISGNLTMRGTTKNITFPAHVEISNGVVKAKANFNINRTDWGLMYGDEASAVDKAKDKFIYNTVNVGFEIEAATEASASAQ